ncbi:MAG: preprotein translocase subunit YajC [Acidimicrobiia bacterium]|nr:preprotein translocase subunit YajC [Acidimicrobiia bacterium]
MFVLAQEGTDAASGGGYSTLIFLALMAVVFYFLIIRPQRKRANEQKELAASLSVGDRVQTIGGMVGRVVAVEEDEVVLEVEGTRIRMVSRAIANRQDTTTGSTEGDTGS